MSVSKTMHFLLSAALFVTLCSCALNPAQNNAASPLRAVAIFNTNSCTELQFTQVYDVVIRYNLADDTLSRSGDTDAKSVRVMTNYMMSSALLNLSQLCIAEALELKDTKEKLLREREILLTGTSLSKNNMKAHRELSAEASGEIRAAANQSEKLKPAQRKSFAFGFSTYAAGGYLTKKTAEQARDLASTLANNVRNSGNNTGGIFGTVTDILNKQGKNVRALQTLNLLATGAGKHVSQLVDTGKSLSKYARKNRVKLGPDATQYADFFSS